MEDDTAVGTLTLFGHCPVTYWLLGKAGFAAGASETASIISKDTSLSSKASSRIARS
jgi:hypothetical protein